MANTNPSDDFDDELLSAYVDGELVGGQRERVEQRLAADPRAAQLVDDLRAMSQELQALPRETVGEDLRVTIMQRAERAMLLGAQEQIAVVPHEVAAGRRWIWAALAIAAALLLTAYLPNMQREQQPLASAKPAPGDPTAKKQPAEPHLEAVTTDATQPPASASAGVRSALAVRASDVTKDQAMVDQEVAVMGRSAAVAPPAPSASDTQELADRTDEVQLTCLVHITLSDKDAAGEQLEKYLVNNGIEFRSGEKLQIRQSASKTKGLAFRSQPRGQPLAAEAAQAEQLVWVEAPTEQVADVLQDLNADTFNCEAVRVTELQPAQQSLGDLRQWERSGSQLAPTQPKAMKHDVLASKKVSPGWATRLDATQYQAGKLNVDRQRLASQRDISGTAAQVPIQVLFIVQQAAPKPTAAVRGEATVPGR